MRPSPTFPSTDRSRQSFTLVELLTAITILVFVTLMLAQMTAMVEHGWSVGQQRVDNFGKGRAMLNLLAQDIQQSVIRPDAPFWPNTNDTSIAFFTLRPGIDSSESASAVRNLSLISYSISSACVLQRGDAPVLWSGTSPSLFTNNPNSPGMFNPSLITHTNNAAPGVIACKLLFIEDGGTRLFYNRNFSTNSIGGTNSVTAVGVTMAVVDSQTYSLISGMGGTAMSRLQALGATLSSLASATNSVKVQWDNYLNQGIDWSQYPKPLATGIKVFEQYVPLPASALPND